jgi:transcriptional regulator with XRE-family HTH domain
LRREEVASRANVGVTWYTWLEQGRDIQVSREVVTRIAAALCLSSSDRSYLESLTGLLSAASDQPRDEAIGEVQDLLDCFVAGPAMLWNYRFDCVAYNCLADELYDWAGSPEPYGRNMIWRTFMDPKRHGLYSEAEHFMHNAVGMLRSRYVSHLGEPDFESLVKDLLDGSKVFSKLWTEQHTASLAPASLVMTHHKFGRLALRSIRAIYPPIPESTLVFVCPLDKSTKAVLEKLLKNRYNAAVSAKGRGRNVIPAVLG